MKICIVEHCNNKYSSKNYCNMHYKRFKKYGDPLKLIMVKNKKCDVGFCNEKHFSLGYCSLHYQRYRIHGNPLRGRIIRHCDLEGCTRKHFFRWLL